MRLATNVRLDFLFLSHIPFSPFAKKKRVILSDPDIAITTGSWFGNLRYKIHLAWVSAFFFSFTAIARRMAARLLEDVHVLSNHDAI
jgi:hypothetical protein